MPHDKGRPEAALETSGEDTTKVTDTAPFQVMPPLSADEYAALKADIAERGVLVAVVIDQDGRTIDGHHRRQICAELGIDYPVEVRKVADDADAREIALTLNVARRHLTREQKRQLIATEIERSPDDSDRAIGRRLGADHKTVGSVRRELSGEFPQSPAVQLARDAETLIASDEAIDHAEQIAATWVRLWSQTCDKLAEIARNRSYEANGYASLREWLDSESWYLAAWFKAKRNAALLGLDPPPEELAELSGGSHNICSGCARCSTPDVICHYLPKQERLPGLARFAYIDCHGVIYEAYDVDGNPDNLIDEDAWVPIYLPNGEPAYEMRRPLADCGIAGCTLCATRFRDLAGDVR
ncbi:ParB N-terminal domain-containing protein [Kribbella sp. NBC_01510]|uniref:ParB N-terminal domain-containing protein n=1 Tax=Kribbella sp. NBC_01510 TaxID=2903581 RepID=UPI00386A3075